MRNGRVDSAFGVPEIGSSKNAELKLSMRVACHQLYSTLLKFSMQKERFDSALVVTEMASDCCSGGREGGRE